MEKLQFDLHRSKIQVGLYSCLLIITFLWLALAHIIIALKLISLFTLLVYSYYVFKHHIFINEMSLIALDLTHHKRYWLLCMNNQKMEAELNPMSIVTPWVVILSFVTLTQYKKTVIIFPDSLPRGMFQKMLWTLRIN